MPPNRRAWIVRRIHQANRDITEAQQWLASIYATLQESHFALSTDVLEIIIDLEVSRTKLREFAIPTFTRTPRDLQSNGDVSRMLANAKPLPNPSYYSQTEEHARTLPCRDPERRRQQQRDRKARLKQTAQEP